MSYGFCVRIQGDMALFTRPEMKGERVSYSCITPSAARGIIEAVCWHPPIRYVIDQITVLNPIRFDSIRRNEVGAMAKLGCVKAAYTSGESYHLDATAERQQRASIILKDVDYLVDAHFELREELMGPEDSAAKFYNMLLRRLRKGQMYYAPCLGCREFPAKVSLVEQDEPRPQSYYAEVAEHDFGYMLHDLDFGEVCTPKFYHAVMRHGVITPRLEEE